MDLNRFETLVEAYGAERGRWPEDKRPLYERFAGHAFLPTTICRRALPDPKGRYTGMFEQGDFAGRGHFERGFRHKRPDVKKEKGTA